MHFSRSLGATKPIGNSRRNHSCTSMFCRSNPLQAEIILFHLGFAPSVIAAIVFGRGGADIMACPFYSTGQTEVDGNDGCFCHIVDVRYSV